MTNLVKGIHHITAIAADPKQTFHFYTHILGLRLVKKSVNQDDVHTYHLFFGDKTGEPGMDLTFFTFQPPIRGSRGAGQVTTISFAVPKNSLVFWEQRFDKYKIKYKERVQHFGVERVIFFDQDGQQLELVGLDESQLETPPELVWTTPDVPATAAIRHFYGARLSVMSLALVEPILTEVLGCRIVGEERKTIHYHIQGSLRAGHIEVVESPEKKGSQTGAGTVHHIAFEVRTEDELMEVRDKVLMLGLYPTSLIDRYYFKSVYFRTPAGILFELATSGPGFTVDEPEGTLGQKLALPPFLENRRQEIEAGLEPL